MKHFVRFVFLGVLILMLGFVLQAQDGTLEDVAANSANYYGQELTLEGTIENFLSPHVFILGGDVMLDNDQVIVINRSGQVLPMNIMEGSRVVVTGTIYPSITEWHNGNVIADFTIDPEVGSNNYYGSLGMMGITGTGGRMGEATSEATDGAMGGTAGSDSSMMLPDWGSFDLDTTSFFYNGWFARDYDNYTVMVINSVNAVMVVAQG